MDFLSNILEQVEALAHQVWLRNLGVLLAVSLLAYFPGWIFSRFVRKYHESPRVERHRSIRVTLELLDVSLWPLWAMVLYAVFGFWVRLTRGSAGDPFRIFPILIFFLLYRILDALTKEFLPAGPSRRRIRRGMIPLIFVLITLQQLGVLGPILNWLATPLFTFGNTQVSAFSILISIAFLAGFVIVSRLLAAFLRSRFLPGLGVDQTVAGSLATLARYGMVVLGIFVALNSLGFDLSTLKIVLGALGVGIGFGLQNIVNNFVSGLIILIERKVKQADIITVAGTDGRVIDIGLRSSVIRTRAGHEIIVPNSDLVTSQVTNFSYHDRLIRVDIPVGVSYAADPNQVRELLLEAVKEDDRVLSQPAPDVLFRQYGESSIDFELRAWIDDPWQAPRVCSKLYFSIWYKLKGAGIEIPFPQRDLHVRSGELKVLMPSTAEEHTPEED
jgi:small-conductance mechanosensitive channel